MAEITFLGTGGAFSAGRRGNLALLIQSGDLRMLVEAGPAILQQLASVGLCGSDIDYLFVSHSHGDHTLGFPMLVLSRLAAPNRLQVYASPGTIATLEMLWTLAYTDFGSSYLKSDWHRLSERDMAEIEIRPGAILRTSVVPHPPSVLTLAARWDLSDGTSVTFATDTTANPKTVALAHGCDLLIHEATHSAVLQPDTDPGKHFHTTARQAGEIAREAGCRRLALVHLNPEISDYPDVLIEEARAGSNLEVIVPEDGERVRL